MTWHNGPVEVPVGYRQWGLRMDGAGQGLENLIRQQHAALPADHIFTLIEVGSAGCVSLRAFSDILRELRGDKWRAAGFDLTPGKAWSLDMAEVARSFGGTPCILNDYDTTILNRLEGMALFLLDDPRAYLQKGFPFNIDLAFIDGCHGKCAGRDFIALETKVALGGIVAFHDYGLLEQGEDYQEHCREFISVRSYVHRLGLNHPTSKGGLRKGWRWVGEIAGSRTRGGDGNSIAVVQRTNEPLEYQPHLSID